MSADIDFDAVFDSLGEDAPDAEAGDTTGDEAGGETEEPGIEDVPDDAPPPTDDEEATSDDDMPADGDGEPPPDTPAPDALLEGDELGALSTRQVTLKINGKEEQKPLSEVISMALKGEGAERRFAEAATIRKEAEAQIQAHQQWETEVKAFFSDVLADPTKFEEGIASLGNVYKYAFDQAVARRLANSVEETKLTPEQRKLRDLERQIAEDRAARQREAEAKKRADEEARRSQGDTKLQALVDTFHSSLRAAGFDRSVDADLYADAWELTVGRGKAMASQEDRALTDEEIGEIALGVAKRLGAGKPPPPPPKAKGKLPPSEKTGTRRTNGAPKKRKRIPIGEFFDSDPNLSDEY